MANEDRTKFDYYFKMNVIEFLNHYVYLLDKMEYKKESK